MVVDFRNAEQEQVLLQDILDFCYQSTCDQCSNSKHIKFFYLFRASLNGFLESEFFPSSTSAFRSDAIKVVP